MAWGVGRLIKAGTPGRPSSLLRAASSQEREILPKSLGRKGAPLYSLIMISPSWRTEAFHTFLGR